MAYKAAVIDIETTALLSEMLDFSSFPYKLKEEAKLWCVVVKDVETQNSIRLAKEDITKEALKKALSPYNLIIAHNGVKFDFITLKLFGVLDYKIGWIGEKDTLFGRDVLFLDTLIVSRLFNPVLKNGHSLDEWGKRLGHKKTDFRQLCIDKGYIKKTDPKGQEFKTFCPEMVDYCENDCLVNLNLFEHLKQELNEYQTWLVSIKQENKLADLAVRRENFGFDLDEEKALECYEDLSQKIKSISDIINPILPSKKANKGEINNFIPPKIQLKKDGTLSNHILKFIEKHNATIEKLDEDYYLIYEDKEFKIPFSNPIKKTVRADISNLDHVKHYLISLGWIPTEWRERDLTKDSKKISLPLEKRVKALDKWWVETMEGKYKEYRLDNLEGDSLQDKYNNLRKKLEKDFPVRIRTSPSVKVGLEKELCSNLVKLGEKVAFAKDFADYLTYKARRSNIAGGEAIEEQKEIEKGYLSSYRQEDGRIPTPAIEIGAISNRYKHISVANIPRVTSLYGKEIRSLFGAGKGFIQYGFDFSGLEARVMGHYVLPYKEGEKLAEQMVAERPDDIHCYSEDTEVLTKDGWKRFNEISTDTEIIQYNDKTDSLEWVKPLEIIWQDYKGDMVSFKSKSLDLLVTPNHRMISFEPKTLNSRVDEAINFEKINRRFKTTSILEEGLEENENLLKLIVATQADGHLNKDCTAITFSFTKQRKIERLLNILNKIEAKYSVSSFNRKNRKEVVIRIKASELTIKIRSFLNIDKSFKPIFLKFSKDCRKTFLNEIGCWDGTIRNNGDIVIDSTCFKSADVVQAVAVSLGYKSNSNVYNKITIHGLCKIKRVYVSTNSASTIYTKNTYKGKQSYEGKIGCVVVPSSFILVRRNGRTIISGNTKNSKKLGISRTDAKSVFYAIIYGSAVKKLSVMLNISYEKAKEIFDNFWKSMPALKELKNFLEAQWEDNKKEFIYGIDGRKLKTRSRHSILNNLFQSCGVICAKYTTIFLFEELEKQGLCIDVFEGKPDVAEMISYHDEGQLALSPSLLSFKTFNSKEEGEIFIKGWDGKQLGALSRGKNEKWFVALPNVISIATENAIKRTSEMLKLNVSLGYEWIVGRNWSECH